MRKEDRVKAQQQGRPEQHSELIDKQPNRTEREEIKGSVSTNQPAKPPKQPGRMPLPE